ncbi:hypothetical protein SAMN04487902_101334 [Prevotella sp. ne3005]|nr:hypothetical protein SAMN04487902_101334 [Prevotella sp. ne3005]
MKAGKLKELGMLLSNELLVSSKKYNHVNQYQ